MICHHYKFIFVHQGKTGGSSVIKSLCGLVPSQTKVVYRDLPKHLSFNELIKRSSVEFRPEDYFKFTIVRNPWDRQVSWYYHWMMTTGETPTFNDWISRPGNVLKYRDLDNMDYIMSTEQLDSDWKHVSNELGSSDLNLGRIDHNTGRPKRNYQSYYNDQSIELVRDNNQEVIDIFDYKFHHDE
jgi:hypothetical protein